MPGVAEGDRDEQRYADSCGIYQPRPCPHADFDPAAAVGLASSSILERKKLAQIALGVRTLEEALLGPAFVGSGVLGSKQRERDR